MRMPRVRFTVRRMMVMVVFIGIGIAATKALIGQTTGRRPAGAVTRPGWAVKAPGQLPLNILRSAGIARLDVATVGRKVSVSGAAQVRDTVPGNSYVWLLRIYRNDEGKALLKEHHYLDRAVTVQAGGGPMSPTFDDAFELPPGAYKVELSLYAVPQDFPFDRLAFGEDMEKKAIIKVGAYKKIVVAG